MASQGIKEGNVVRYVGRERRDELGHGQLGRVGNVAKNGKCRLQAMTDGGKGLASPVWVAPDEIEYVAASSSLGAGPKLPVAKPEPTPSPKVADAPAPTVARKPEPFPIEIMETTHPAAVPDTPVVRRHAPEELNAEDKSNLDRMLDEAFGGTVEVAGEECELECAGCVLIESRGRRDGTRKVCVTISEDAKVSDSVRRLVMEALGGA